MRDEELQVLEGAIAAATGHYEIASSEPVAGGCIHRALRLRGEDANGKRDYFAKLNESGSAAMFAAEAEGLGALRDAAALRVPRRVALGHDDDRAWLVLEWLELAPLDAKSAAALGAALAQQHRAPREKFGWARDNFIGASHQVNGWSDDWIAFWRAKRLHPQLRLAAHRRLPSRMIDRGERLMADCEVFFRTYAPAKSLLHGDLWSGNAARCGEASPVVFDPAVYVGDREADVAMTELFGGFPADFISAYRAAWALDDGYPVRREFYNLYHRLNHANLFAGRYVRDSEHAIERLLAEVA
jgi:fructosamine-3-kinase